MERLEFEFEVITPIFLGGASPNGEAELRPPSIKGMLRWWFRTLGGSREWEEKIFGSTGNRSKLALRITKNHSDYIVPFMSEFSGDLAYIGYGPITWDRNSRSMKNTRAFINVGSSFNLSISLNLSDRDRKAVLLSLWALVHFGGIGSRNRRGWGSIKVMNHSKNEYLRWHFKDADEFVEYLNVFLEQVKILGTLPKDLPEYSRISKKTRILISKGQFDSYNSALENVAREMIDFRNRKYYHDIKLLMQMAENPDRLPEFLNPTNKNSFYNTPVPKAIFGLPNNYMSRSRRGNRRKGIPPQYPWQVSVDAITNNDSVSRRASPLLIKIAKWDSGKYNWIIMYLPSKFLPDGALLKLAFPKGGLPSYKDRDRTLEKLRSKLINKIVKANPPSYKLLEEFLSGLNSVREVSL